MKIFLKTKEEIAIMRQGGYLLAKIFDHLVKKIKPGVSTKELEEIAFNLIYQNKAKPAFLGQDGFPSCLCTSLNEEIVHVLPSKRVLKEGDILKLDLGIIWKGFYLDKAATFSVGKISSLARKLIKTTEKCLKEGIKKAKPGNFLGDIGWTIERCAKKNGFNVIRSLGGHGIGRSLHEP
ncbi:MAG: type I methionyl aminopeptidase, partial [Minisyncoccales bacterium]